MALTIKDYVAIFERELDTMLKSSEHEDVITSKTIKSGFEKITLETGQKVQVRYGNLNSPTVMFLDTVPQGKKWDITVSIYIEETDV